MKIRTFTMTLVITAVVWLLAAPLMTGCGNDNNRVSDSNANNVKNSKSDVDNVGLQKKEQQENGVQESGVQENSPTLYASMSEIKNAVAELLGDNYWPDKQLTEEELETETGITPDMYEDYLAENLNVETDIDMMIILKAKPEYLTEMETMLNEYRDSLMTKYKERPQELGKVTASRIEIIDSYICFVQLGADTEAAAKIGAEEVLELCQQENERVVDIIEKTILE